MKLLLLAFSVFLFASFANANDVPVQDAENRLRMAMQTARERNDKALVAEVEATGRRVMADLRAGKEDGVDARLRAVEVKVGLDAGGRSMAGQPLFTPTPEMLAESKTLGAKLGAAMQSGDASQVRAITAEMLRVLGDQAGVPDGRRAGKKVEPRTISEDAATKLFLDALAGESRRLRPLLDGEPLPDQMVRIYAYVLTAANSARPFAAKHQPEALANLDRLTRGVTRILIDLQQSAGHFPFPDLRGKNIRFGDLIEKQMQAGRVETRDGWIVTPDPDGGSQFDTGLGGAALLAAGELHARAEWKRAGLRAADWALSQPCCPNFNYNAFSVSLLAQAFRSTGELKYLEGALQKFRVGVAPGQAPNGRWIDAHNARTVYHTIILRALADLRSVLPADRRAERAEVDRITQPAITALLDEFDAMGITVEALPELLALSEIHPDDARLRAATESMSASIVAKCTDGQRVKMGAQPHQLASVPAAVAWLAR